MSSIKIHGWDKKPRAMPAMTKFLSLIWLLLATWAAYAAFSIIITMVTDWRLADAYPALIPIFLFAATLSFMNALFLWRRKNAWFVDIVSLLYLMYFWAILLLGQGGYEYLVSLPGIALCMATLVVASKQKLPTEGGKK